MTNNNLRINLIVKCDMHDLHATNLYALGLDHERLTYRYSGRFQIN
jgi:hypothetical protein